MRNYALDTKMLPKVWVTWTTVKNGRFDKRYWLNCQTGKKKTTPEDWMIYTGENDICTRYWRGNYNYGCTYHTSKNDKIWVASGSSVKYCYIKYHKDIDRLELAAIGFDTSRKPEKHHWKFLGDRFFIGKDKSVINQRGDKVTSDFFLYKHHTAWNAKIMLSMLLRLHIPKDFVNEFKKFIGAGQFVIGNGTSVAIEAPWHLQKWYQSSQKVRGKGKEQKLTDELVKLPLKNLEEFKDKLVPTTVYTSCYERIARHIVYYERINTEWSVLRSFHVLSDAPTEIWRMYISDDGKHRIASPGTNGWVPSRQPHCWWGQYEYVVNQDEAIEKCNRIKYVLPNDLEETKVVQYIMTALRFPEIEQLAKFGYGQTACRVAQSYTPKAYLKDEFGGYYNDKKKNLLQKVGLTKPQFDHYMYLNNDWSAPKSLRTMRALFGKDLSHMDIKSFEKCLTGCRQINNRYWQGFENYVSHMDIDKARVVKNLTRLSAKRNDIYTIFADTLSAYTNLNYGTQPDINWYFDDVSDAVRAHDAIIELKRIQDEERRAMWDMEAAERRKKEDEKRIKVDEERKQYEYEDDEYIIRLPKDSNEIVEEGSKQRICIGGYTTRHAMGHTNLFFLRKKDEESTPFYAIEMNNNKTIEQIHGSCNQWLGVHPEAIPTVVRWLRKHDIKCDEKILTCTAKGYSRIDNYVPMPVVD